MTWCRSPDVAFNTLWPQPEPEPPPTLWALVLEDPFGPPPPPLPPPPPDPRFGVAGIRDPDAPCHMFDDSGWGPKNGDCDTDGHYLCDECSHMSLRTYRERHEKCTLCGIPLVCAPWSREPSMCPFCDEEWLAKESARHQQARLKVVR